MKRLFIHYPLFRMLCPLATGALVYLLILLANNNVEMIKETFLTKELYVCIGLAYIIQETTRILLIMADQVLIKSNEWWKLGLQVGLTLIITLTIVTFAMKVYYLRVLGFSANLQELLIFNLLFAFIAMFYLLLYKGHDLLYQVNKAKLSEEEAELAEIKSDFEFYTSKINSRLLYESLETIMVIMNRDTDLAEEFTDDFSALYRYQLTRNGEELVLLEEELKAVEVLLRVYKKLPYRAIHLEVSSESEGLVVPGSILSTIEAIIRSSILDMEKELPINLRQEEGQIVISYKADERFENPFTLALIPTIIRKYKIYSDEHIQLIVRENYHSVIFPNLQIV